tara:strand:+ start:3158 stop:3481 length:324 start_codon:yes stop_codon:yes gene_type:complete
MKILGFLLIVIAMVSCSSPVSEYELDQNGEKVQLKLFKDSTFVSLVKKGKEQHSFAGYWKGKLEEGFFSTFATRDGFEVLKREVKRSYVLTNNNLKEVSMDTLPAKF